LPLSPVPELPPSSDGDEIRAERAYGDLPLAFEPSAGRLDRGVDFVARSASGTVLLGSDRATFARQR
jgi:hypothetical protein